MQNLPQVKLCDVLECCFNRDKKCHAGAIQVGDDHPACDTFTTGKNKAGVENMVANVGACKIDACTFNNNLECGAPGITVGHHGSHADCQTYKHR
ncbi:MAG TPA: DUF1540 domain-containing protein [Cyanobacteria bacterium UBA8530]|nr:DUF1540 domain-containing protein [Cyanobacteria bacterium UBA8530]